MKNRYQNAKIQIKNILFPNEFECEVPVLKTIAPGSTVIIGHAYGSPIIRGDFISPKVKAFIKQNAENLDNVIFSGDVIESPSRAKWNRLQKFSSETGVNFHIAPGNHDVGFGDNAKRDIWLETPYSLRRQSDGFFKTSGFSVFLEDSIETGWQMSESIIQAVNADNAPDPKIIIRHNIAVYEQFIAANSRKGINGVLPTFSEFNEILPPKTFVISGDAGAFPHQDRLVCLGNAKTTFIASGVGDVEGDLVLVLSRGEIFQTQLETTE